MSPRGFPTSNPGTDFDRSIDAILRRIEALEQGRHRAPGSSFGVPFILTNGDDTWLLDIDATGNLTATHQETGAVTVLA